MENIYQEFSATTAPVYTTSATTTTLSKEEKDVLCTYCEDVDDQQMNALTANTSYITELIRDKKASTTDYFCYYDDKYCLLEVKGRYKYSITDLPVDGWFLEADKAAELLFKQIYTENNPAPLFMHITKDAYILWDLNNLIKKPNIHKNISTYNPYKGTKETTPKYYLSLSDALIISKKTWQECTVEDVRKTKRKKEEFKKQNINYNAN